MRAKMSILIIAAAILGVIGAACVSSRPEGPPQQLEPQVVGIRVPTGPDEPVEPDASASGMITILDTIDPNECSFIHNINACFSDGLPPADIPLGEYMDVYFMAKQDLSDRTGEDHFGAKINGVERVDWNDASLGNPEAGAFYAQVITPGFRLVLESGGAFHTYHTSLDRVVFVESN